MAKFKDNQIVIVDGEGNEHLVDVLFTYENEHRHKQYVFFVNPENDEEVMVMSYTDEGDLEAISDEEYEEAEEVFNAFEEENEEEEQ